MAMRFSRLAARIYERMVAAKARRYVSIWALMLHLRGRAYGSRFAALQWSAPAGDRPGRCRLIKGGTVMLGWAELEVAS